MLPALNVATVFAGILIASLVDGLMPVLAARFLALNVPKPTKATLPSVFNPLVTPAIVASKARKASAFVELVSLAINSTNSCFVIINTSYILYL